MQRMGNKGFVFSSFNTEETSFPKLISNFYQQGETTMSEEKNENEGMDGCSLIIVIALGIVLGGILLSIL